MILISENRKARFDFFILNTVEAGIVLTGTEVKSLRKNKTSLGETHIIEKGGEMWIHNLHIIEYGPANRFNHDPKRIKKLLLRKREIGKLSGQAKQEGATIVPLSMYFNNVGIVKFQIALVKGKKKHDKRESIKKRDWERDKQRMQ